MSVLRFIKVLATSFLYRFFITGFLLALATVIIRAAFGIGSFFVGTAARVMFYGSALAGCILRIIGWFGTAFVHVGEN
jgi:hypothetical protein